MASVAITPVVQAFNTRSADLVSAGTAITDAANNQFVITPGAKNPPTAMCLIFEADGSGDTVTITAGDYPPSHLKNLGAVSIVLAASDLRAVWIESARHMQSDGTIIVTCGDDGTRCYVMALPPGLAGGSGIS
ncbi:MAG: hypothetical protein AB7I38_18450 [Dehalococcoidia bacterium]